MAAKGGNKKVRPIVTGVKEIDKALRKIPIGVQKKVLRKVMREAMRPVAAEVKSEAPKESGVLAKSAKLKASKRSRKGFGINVQIGVNEFPGDKYYAAFQEFGTSEFDENEYMKRAYNDTATTARKTAMDGILQGIINEANRAKVKDKGKK